MTTTVQSNPTYYSLSSYVSSLNTLKRGVVLQKRPDHDGFGVYIGEDFPSGLYIVTVERGSPAADVDLQPGDRIVAINGQSLSMIRNPKEILVQAANNTQVLHLTIETTNILQELNIPVKNNYVNERKPTKEKSFSRPISNTNPEIESYVQSIFSNESVQLVPSSNPNEFILYRNRSENPNPNVYPDSSTQFDSYPSHNSHSQAPQQPENHQPHSHHHHHHHRPHGHSKRKILVTKETQTSMDEDEDVEGPIPVPTIPQKPSMGTSHRLLRSQKTSANDYQSTNQSPLSGSTKQPITTVSQPERKSKSNRSAEITPDQKSQHMANIVEAAMAAQRKREAVQKREQNSLPEPVVAAAAAAALTTSELPDPKGSPPPYAAKDPLPRTTAENRISTNEGSYNVRNAQENRKSIPSDVDHDYIPPSITGPNIRVVHLHRVADFQGFGFHVQYNRTFFLVHKIEDDSPSFNGDLRLNDVILSINQQPTENMAHATFVQQVNESSDVDFVVQPLEDYLTINPRPPSKLLLGKKSTQ